MQALNSGIGQRLLLASRGTEQVFHYWRSEKERLSEKSGQSPSFPDLNPRGQILQALNSGIGQRLLLASRGTEQISHYWRSEKERVSEKSGQSPSVSDLNPRGQIFASFEL